MKKGESFVEGITRILMLQNVLKEDEAQAYAKAFKDTQRDDFDQYLIEQGIVTRMEMLQALSTYYTVPSFDVVGFLFDHQMVHTFPKDFLLRNKIIPLEHDDNIMVMIAANPQDQDLLPKIGKYVSYDIVFNVGLGQDITDAVSEFSDASPAEVRDPNEPEETPEQEHDEHDDEPDYFKTSKE